MFSKTIPPQPLLSSFTSEIQKAFEEYFDNKTELRKTFINITKRTKYLQYLANSEKKIHKINKIERKYFNAIKQQVIKKYYMDFCGQLLHITQKKGDIIKLQAFVYDTFDYIEWIYAVGGHNGYKKTYQQIKKKVHRISRDDIQQLFEYYQVYFVNYQNLTRAPL